MPFSLGIKAYDSNTQVVTNYTGTISLEIGGVFTAFLVSLGDSDNLLVGGEPFKLRDVDVKLLQGAHEFFTASCLLPAAS